MKRIIIALIALSLVIVSCKPAADDSSPYEKALVGSWSIGLVTVDLEKEGKASYTTFLGTGGKGTWSATEDNLKITFILEDGTSEDYCNGPYKLDGSKLSFSIKGKGDPATFEKVK